MPESRDAWFRSSDGLRLYAQDSGPIGGTAMPVLCLAGLTRNSRDFETIVPWLASERRVVCLDYRGRGRSQYAPDPVTYRPDMEADDALRLLDTLGLDRIGIIGTSRGGIVAMFMAAMAKQRIAGILFNDIGPALDVAGLLRIRSYLGKNSNFTDWGQAVASLKQTNPGLDDLSEDRWRVFARRIFRDENGRPVLDYDVRLGEAFPSAEDIAAGKLQPLWPLFDGLAGLPVGVLRGENSDLLSVATVAEMASHHPGLDATTVPHRAHVPFLDEPESQEAIARWLGKLASP
jgi:pimeloyl-ACP methyl ester carboxylesterase